MTGATKAKGITKRADLNGLWWPDDDPKSAMCYAKVLSHIQDMDITIALCPQRRVCVQAGGHVGLWPIRLARTFVEVYSYECDGYLYECARRNIHEIGLYGQIDLTRAALADFTGSAAFDPRRSSSSGRLTVTGKTAVRVTTIDERKLPVCDALFLDVEGSEVRALDGAVDTIARCRPVLHLEELAGTKTAIQEYVRDLRYTLHSTSHSDAIYVPNERR